MGRFSIRHVAQCNIQIIYGQVLKHCPMSTILFLQSCTLCAMSGRERIEDHISRYQNAIACGYQSVCITDTLSLELHRIRGLGIREFDWPAVTAATLLRPLSLVSLLHSSHNWLTFHERSIRWHQFIINLSVPKSNPIPPNLWSISLTPPTTFQ